jgi:hypothetical protein
MTVALRRCRYGTEIVLAAPGLYPITGDGICSCHSQEFTVAAGFLAINVIGDFVSSLPHGREILLNSRAPLGRLQKLQEGDVIEIHQGKDRGGKNERRTRFVYARKTPPIRFALPASSAVRCAYTQRSLAGESAVRCAWCFKLFDVHAWAGELRGCCPSCGWPHEESSS